MGFFLKIKIFLLFYLMFSLDNTLAVSSREKLYFHTFDNLGNILPKAAVYINDIKVGNTDNNGFFLYQTPKKYWGTILNIKNFKIEWKLFLFFILLKVRNSIYIKEKKNYYSYIIFSPKK